MGKNFAQLNKSLIENMSHIQSDMYTKQTLKSLFRALLETVIESNDDSVVLMKISEKDQFLGLLSRLKFSKSKVFIVNSNDEGFNSLNLSEKVFLDDEFLMVFADRFSSALCWTNKDSNPADLVEGFCTFNPSENKELIDILSKALCSKDLNSALAQVKQDRRHNEKFTTIMTKLLFDLEESQRDLICNTVQKQLEEKVNFDKVASEVTHELRNPLGMIDLYSKIIDKSAEKLLDNPEIAKSLQNAANSIAKAVKNMESLLVDLKNHSNYLEKESLNLGQYNAKQLLENAYNLVLPLAHQQQIDLVLEADSSFNTVLEVDENKFGQVLINLLKNAVESIEQNGKIILKQEEKANQTIIKIIDNGCGIKKEDQEKIFLPYFTKKQSGSGIGLAHSKKVMELLGGNLYLESSDENGSVFVIEVPGV